MADDAASSAAAEPTSARSPPTSGVALGGVCAPRQRFVVSPSGRFSIDEALSLPKSSRRGSGCVQCCRPPKRYASCGHVKVDADTAAAVGHGATFSRSAAARRRRLAWSVRVCSTSRARSSRSTNTWRARRLSRRWCSQPEVAVSDHSATSSDSGAAALVDSAVTIGAYDGVHRGHRAVLRLVQRARRRACDLDSVVVTFDRHPAEIVRPESRADAAHLARPEARTARAPPGSSTPAWCSRSTRRAARRPADEFVHSVLVGRCARELVVVGADFHFGYRRGGNVALLDGDGRRSRIRSDRSRLVAAVARRAAVLVDPRRDAARRWRRRRSGRDARSAARGARRRGTRRRARPRARLSHRERRGRRAHLPACRRCLRRHVHRCRRHRTPRGDLARPPARRSTTSVALRLLEPYLLDFDGDLYDQQVEVRFHHLLRPS